MANTSAPASTSQQGRPLPVVAVRGEAELEVDPDVAELTLTIQAGAADRGEAMRRLVQRLTAARELLAGYGSAVERSEGSLWVHPVWNVDQRGRNKKITGYEGRVPITVTVSAFDVLDEVVLGLAGLEETELNGPDWQLRPTNPAYLQAREQAVGAAVERARQYAAALGSTLVDLLELSDQGMSGGPGRRVQARFAAAKLGGFGGADEQPLELQPQPQTVHAAVEARFTMTAPALG